MTKEDGPGRWKLSRSQLWGFLNSSFGLFFFSSVVLSLVTWSYTEFSHSLQQRNLTKVNVTKLDTEISYRIRLIQNYFESECSEHSNLSLNTFQDIRKLYKAEPEYQSIFPENKQKDLHILIWERAALSEATQKQVFIRSFNALLSFNAYLNRFVSQTGQDGKFYGEIPDFRAEVTALQKSFSNATRAVAQEQGFATATTATDSFTNASSLSLHRDASGSATNAKHGMANPPPVQIDAGKGEATLAAMEEGLERSVASAREAGATDTAERSLGKPFLMAIQDVFSIPGRGTVATGRIEQGTVKVGEEVEIVGIKEKVKTVVTGVEMFGKVLDKGVAGDYVGCLLQKVKREEIKRGQVLAKPGSIAAHTRFNAQIHLSTKEEGGRHTPIVSPYRPQLYFRTTEVAGQVELPMDKTMVMPGERVEVKVKLMVPIAMDKGLPFKLREGGRTIGAGIVTSIIE